MLVEVARRVLAGEDVCWCEIYGQAARTARAMGNVAHAGRLMVEGRERCTCETVVRRPGGW